MEAKRSSSWRQSDDPRPTHRPYATPSTASPSSLPGLAGFMDCSDVFDALGFDRVNASGTPRSVMQVAYRWIADAGFEVEYVIPDGITDVPKSQRTGCYADDLPAIVAYKDAWYAELTATRNGMLAIDLCH